jgi:hypothetical protein
MITGSASTICNPVSPRWQAGESKYDASIEALPGFLPFAAQYVYRWSIENNFSQNSSLEKRRAPINQVFFS